MNVPPVHYATTSDGLSIAYATSGQGRPFVLLPGAFEHVQLGWQYPLLATWLEGLAARFQLVQLDVRGAGMSTRGLTTDHEMSDYQLDIEAVIDRLNPAPFVLCATTYRAACAVEFALKYPDRVYALVLGPTRLARGPTGAQTAFFNTLPRESWDLFLRSLASLYQRPEDVTQCVALLKQAFDQDDFAQHMRLALQGVSPESVARLRTPTLVLEPRDYFGHTGDSDAIRIAQLAKATLTTIDGKFALGDAEQGIRAIEAFLTDLPPSSAVPGRSQHSTLSSREIEVLRLIAVGKSNQQIADELVISFNTVQRHVGNILAKTGLNNRTEAAAYARDEALL